MRDLLFSFFSYSKYTCRHVFSWYIKVEDLSSCWRSTVCCARKIFACQGTQHVAILCWVWWDEGVEGKGRVYNFRREHRQMPSDAGQSICWVPARHFAYWLADSFFYFMFLFLFLRRLLFAFWWTSQVISLRISSGSAASDSNVK